MIIMIFDKTLSVGNIFRAATTPQGSHVYFVPFGLLPEEFGTKDPLWVRMEVGLLYPKTSIKADLVDSKSQIILSEFDRVESPSIQLTLGQLLAYKLSGIAGIHMVSAYGLYDVNGLPERFPNLGVHANMAETVRFEDACQSNKAFPELSLLGLIGSRYLLVSTGTPFGVSYSIVKTWAKTPVYIGINRDSLLHDQGVNNHLRDAATEDELSAVISYMASVGISLNTELISVLDEPYQSPFNS